LSGGDLGLKEPDFVERFWNGKGINTGGMYIYDGSGLSRYNTVTTKQVALLLKYMKANSRYSEYFIKSIPTAGREGTVKYICKGTYAENNMRVKSGLMKKVRAFSGYLTTRSGREVAFSFIINNHNDSSKEVTKKMEKVLTALAELTI
jgi:D-alanyl-D-alanine carboxypeptidase/D-alanyl-D-alanine-endopeptidase (penicillin-binding protein 4)